MQVRLNNIQYASQIQRENMYWKWTINSFPNEVQLAVKHQ